MKYRFQKIIVFTVMGFCILVPLLVSAQATSNFWKIFGGVLQPNLSTWGLKIPSFGGSGTRCLQVDNTGLFSVFTSGCGGGGGSGGGTFSTTTAWGSILYNYPNNDSDILTIGYDGAGVATSTNEAEFVIDPTAKLASFLNGMKLGIGTTTPYTALSVVGEVVASNFTATGTSASTFTGNVGIGGVPTYNTLFVGDGSDQDLGYSESVLIQDATSPTYVGYSFRTDATHGGDFYYGVSEDTVYFETYSGAIPFHINSIDTQINADIGGTGKFVVMKSDVGIGTSTPAYLLDVYGTGYFEDDLIISGTATTSSLAITGTGTSTIITGNVEIGGNLNVVGFIELEGQGEVIAVAVAAALVAVAAAVITFTNKRITPRVTNEVSSGTPTINTNNTDIHRITALAENITSMTTNLSGSPNHGESLIVEITGTATRTITWGASFESSTVSLPTTTDGTNLLSTGLKWNSATSKWRCLAVS